MANYREKERERERQKGRKNGKGICIDNQGVPFELLNSEPAKLTDTMRPSVQFIFYDSTKESMNYSIDKAAGLFSV